VNGLAAALLGVCATELRQPITCQSSDPSASPERIAGSTVFEIIGSRLGMASYFSRLDALLQRPKFIQAAGKAQGSDSTGALKGGLPRLFSRAGPVGSSGHLAHLSRCPSTSRSLRD